MDSSPDGAGANPAPQSPRPGNATPRLSSGFGWGSSPSSDPVAVAQRHIQCVPSRLAAAKQRAPVHPIASTCRTLHAELDQMRAQAVEREAALDASQHEVERLRRELDAANAAHQLSSESAAAELAQLRARLRSLAGVADGVSTASQRAQRAGAAAARAAAAALQLERELGPLLVRVQAIRAEADAAAHAAQDDDDNRDGVSAGGLHSPLKLPGGPPSEAAVEWPDAATGEEWPHADCDASSVDDGGGPEATARKANSTSAAFDTLSVASLNTDDGRLTYANSEYTTHLGGVESDDGDGEDRDAASEHAGGEGSVAASEHAAEGSVAASSPRHSESAAAVRRAPGAWLDPPGRRSPGRVRFTHERA
jgi:hypothetical protein